MTPWEAAARQLDQRFRPVHEHPAALAASLDPTFRTPPHVELLSREIARTVRYAQDGSGPRGLIVSMPPRVGKSHTASVWTPLWFLSRWPDKNVILATHDGNLSTLFGRKVRDLAREYREAVGFAVSDGTSAASEWETSHGGGMVSRGIGGSITGRGAHLMLLDDPIKDFVQAHSAAVRDSQWDWWLSTAQTRLEPGAAVVLTMTRWHESDLAGRLQSREHEGDPDEWRVIRVPAVSEGPDVTGIPPDALGRAEGVPLTLASVDETEQEAAARWEKTRRGVGSYIWGGLYQGVPSEPKGTVLRRGWWQYYRRSGDEVVLPDGTRIAIGTMDQVQSWDLTFKKKEESDWVVGQVWGRHGGRFFLLDQWREKADLVGAVTGVRRLSHGWPDARHKWVEDGANGPAVVSVLRGEIPGLVLKPPRGDKLSRAWSVQPFLEAGNVWLPDPDQAEWVRGLVDEAAAFPTGQHDDQVDAVTQALIHLTGSSATSIGVPSGQLTGRGLTALTRRTIG